MIKGIENFPHLVGSLPRLTNHRVKINCVMARFVAMGILTDQTGNVR